jgi:nitrile hydratase accessory protein
VERLLAELPEAGAIPRTEGGLAFDAPWEVRVLGLAIELQGEGHFPWSDFQSRLVTAIREWEETSPGERGAWSYYRCWRWALERLAEERGLIDANELEELTQEFLCGKRDPRHR